MKVAVLGARVVFGRNFSDADVGGGDKGVISMTMTDETL